MDRIKLALFDTKFFEEATERMLESDGRGSLDARMKAFRGQMEQAKQRNKKVLENKLTQEDITNLTSNISRVDDNLVSKSKQTEEVQRITAEIEKKMLRLIEDSFGVIRTEKGEISDTLAMIRRESEFNHGKYFDRAFEMEQRISKATVETEFKLGLIEARLRDQPLKEMQEALAKHDYVISRLIAEGLVEPQHEPRRPGASPRPARGECNTTLIRGILMRSTQRRFRLKSKSLVDHN